MEEFMDLKSSCRILERVNERIDDLVLNIEDELMQRSDLSADLTNAEIEALLKSIKNPLKNTKLVGQMAR